MELLHSNLVTGSKGAKGAKGAKDNRLVRRERKFGKGKEQVN
jgi:hypothetical protein